MNKLKSLVKSSMPQNECDTIFWGEPTHEDYASAIQAYTLANWQDKIAFQQRLNKKMNKFRGVKYNLAVLHLMSLLVEHGNRFNELKANNASTIDLSLCKNQKQTIGELQFYKMYFNFVSKQNEKPFRNCNTFQNLSLQEQIEYSELAIHQIKQIIQSELIIDSFFKISKNKILGYMALDSILKSISLDMFLMKNLICDNYELIIHGNPQMVRLNYIYQNLVSFSKSKLKQKLLSLNKRLNNKYDLIFYDFDADVNNSIEIAMKNRSKESQQYLLSKICRSQKILATPNSLNQEVIYLGMQCNMTIDQNDILINNPQA